MDLTLSNQLTGFFKRYKPLIYKKGETIICSYDQPSGVYFLDEGFVKMNSTMVNGEELTLNIFKPGSFFPMMWAIADTENVYSYQTMTGVVVYKAPKVEATDFIRGNPEVLYDLTKRVLTGIDGLLTNFQYILFGSASNRIASVLLICAKRFGEKNSDGPLTIKLRLTHQDIANIAGLTRETTSIEIGRLVKRGLIVQKRGLFTVPDYKKMEAEVQIEKEPTMTPEVI